MAGRVEGKVAFITGLPVTFDAGSMLKWPGRQRCIGTPTLPASDSARVDNHSIAVGAITSPGP